MNNKMKIKDKLLEHASSDTIDSDLLNYFIENYENIEYMSFEEFCHRTDSSLEKGKEFINNLGFEEFSLVIEFIKSIEYSCRVKDKTEKFNDEFIDEIIDNLTDLNITNILNLKKTLNTTSIGRLVEEIINAPEIIIVGTRASTPLVQYATYIFNKIGIRAIKLDSANSNILDNIPNLERSSLVIAFGFQRYPKETIILLKLLRSKGFNIVSITDSTTSPLTKFSEYSIISPSNSFEYTDSYISAMLTINTIIVAIGKRNPEKLVKHLKSFDETALNLGYFL